MAYTQQKNNPLQGDALTVIPATASENSFSVIGHEIITKILAGYRGGIAIRLWDGALAHGTFNAHCTVIFREPGALRDLILHRNLLRLADSYLTGAIDVEGDLESLFALKTHLANLDLSLGAKLQLLHQALRLPVRSRSDSAHKWHMNRNVHRNCRSSIAHHYDVSNDFYRLWLDPEMVYSCAYFKSVDQSLADAQQDKLDYLCRKLRLEPGQTLLDIGCGWGALALWAARHYGVQVHGITLSQEQQRLAQERVHAAGLEEQVRIELLDYRDLPEHAQYDRVVSVGMFEHVGVKNFPTYFGTVRRVLKPSGLFLNHGITSENGWQHTPQTSFMNRYIFPDGELARISDVTAVMERAGFEILDVESLRRHYALTLRHWVRALESGRDKAIRHSSEKTYRLWRLYMAGCAFHFDEGGIGLQQVLVGHRHQLQPVSLRRDDLYTGSGIDREKQP
ncbi:MAG: C17 cyclopropane fatty acid synthase CfaB [Gammaproteobacteria bacterium]|nr:MAG: C17 cyclopropane fatty acid synthase CfaB [Gammaproteobacteria bacterium]